MLAEYRVGPTASQDGGINPGRAGKTGEVVVTDAHGKYYEMVSRGRCFHASMQAGATLGNALTTAASTLTLYNPLNSGVNLALLHTSLAITTVASNVSDGYYVYAVNVNPFAAAPTATTAATIRNCLLGGSAGSGLAYTAATLPAAPVVARVCPGGMYWATGADATAPMVLNDYVDGALVLPQNTAVTIQGMATVANVSGIVSFMWEEVPV